MTRPARPAADDLIAEKWSLGYWKSALRFAECIALVAFGAFVGRLNAVVSYLSVTRRDQPQPGAVPA